MTTALRRTALLGALCAASAGAGISCGSGGSTASTTTGATGPTGTGGAPATSSATTGQGGSGGTLFTSGTGSNTGPFNDFPKDPVVDPSAPAGAAGLFGPAGSGDPMGGPCLFEPEPGTLFPSNWLRPRFRFNAGPNENLFEIRLHTPDEIDDLVVYTAGTSWTMPKPMWLSLAQHATGGPITMTVRGAHYNGTTLDGAPAVGTSGPMTIAPAEASGAIVYWTTSGGSALKGFQIGDESVGPTLTPQQAKMPTVGGTVTCIGCHTSTPDGLYAAFTAQAPWGNALASIEQGTVGAQPPFLSVGALSALTTFGELGIQTYSKAHWKNGDYTMVTPFDKGTSAKLAWFDLQGQSSAEGQAYGFLKRDGDPRGVGAPTWSHDGKTVVYVSTNAETTGRLDNGDADLYAVPYNDRAGGTAVPVPGASDPNLEEYYPAFSPDDAMLAFNRIPSKTNMYNAVKAEVFVIPAAGGTATRIAANDPAECVGAKSPGVTNSWPKWAPEGTTVNGKTYYWLIFSSTRGPMGNPQLYVTGVVTEAGKVSTYSALYLWNQPEMENNHTPAWDIFKIPAAPPPQ